jgi:hypothetical protein
LIALALLPAALHERRPFIFFAGVLFGLALFPIFPAPCRQGGSSFLVAVLHPAIRASGNRGVLLVTPLLISLPDGT